MSSVRDFTEKVFVKKTWQTKELGIKGSEWEIYSFIYSFYDGGFPFFASYSYISKRLGITRQTVYSSVASLVEKNLIREELRSATPGTDDFNVQRFLIPTIDFKASHTSVDILKYDWQLQDLGLKGLEWDIYALIFSKTELSKTFDTCFCKKVSDLAEMLNVADRRVNEILKNLIDKNYIVYAEDENDVSDNGFAFKPRKYLANLDLVKK